MKTNILCIFLFLFIGCQNKDNNSDPPLLKTKRILTSFQSTKTNSIINYPSVMTNKEYVIFTDSLNVLKIGSFCNGCNSSYILGINDSIKIRLNYCTAIACENIQWQIFLFNNLDSAYSFKMNSNQLQILSKGIYNLNFVSASN